MSYVEYELAAFAGLDPGQAPDVGTLFDAVSAVSWSPRTFERILRVEDSPTKWRVFFDAALDGGQTATLNGLISAHTGSDESAGSEPTEPQGVVHASSVAWSSTYSESFQDKLTLNLSAGTWLLMWNYTWAMNSTSRDFIARILEGAGLIWEHRQEPQDSGGTGSASQGTDQVHPASGFAVVTPSSSTDYKIQWRTSDDEYQASIGYARMVAWRIS